MRNGSAYKLGVMLFAVAAFCLLAQAQNPSTMPTTKSSDVSGTWKWSMETPNGVIENSAALKQDGDKISGTVTQGFDGSTVKIEEGKIKDGQVSLKYSVDFNGNTIVLNYSGALHADAIKGQLAITFGGQDGPVLDWNAKRAADAPATAPAAK